MIMPSPECPGLQPPQVVPRLGPGRPPSISWGLTVESAPGDLSPHRRQRAARPPSFGRLASSPSHPSRQLPSSCPSSSPRGQQPAWQGRARPSRVPTNSLPHTAPAREASYTHTHTHTHSLSLSLTHTHTHTHALTHTQAHPSGPACRLQAPTHSRSLPHLPALVQAKGSVMFIYIRRRRLEAS